MPSTARAQSVDSSVIFVPVLGLTLILWVLYRSVFHFPVWFDETIGKALFFGLPVWLYITISQDKSIADTFSWEKFEPGILLGLAFGGIYGFATSLFFVWAGGGAAQPAQLFLAPGFWNEFVLAVCTGFWETLLFFSFIQTVIVKRYRNWSMSSQVLAVAVIFIVFHLPNAILRADMLAIASQSVLLGLFGIGQALLFYRLKNSYVLLLSHAFWGLVLMVHGSV